MRAGTNGARRLGIVGGVGPAATARLYHEAVERVRQATGGRSPAVIISSLPVDQAMERAFVGRRAGVRAQALMDRMLDDSVTMLANGGATAVALPCNTLHPALRRAMRGRGLPLLDMVEAVLERVSRAGHRRGLVIGSASTRSLSVYEPAAASRGLELVYPAPRRQREISALIMDTLGDPDGPHLGLRLPALLTGGLQGATCVIVACTDLSFAPLQAACGLPVFDSLSCLTDLCVDHLLHR